MTDLTGKVAVVTGASKGIGAGIAKTLAAAGAAVVVNYSSDKKGADAAVAAIEQAGGKAVAVQGNVSQAADVDRLFTEAQKAYGQVDILVNNAGVFSFAPLEAITEAEFQRQFNTNVFGTILTTQAAAKHFGPNGGSIVNLTSVASVAAMPTSAVYSASKSAVDTLTRIFAIELAPKKIRVNAVAPGMTQTEGFEAMGMPDEMVNAMAASIPLGRVGQPADIAQSVLFLASDDSAWVTGERLTASGGQR
jgi:3-oxoacyl-[acyl-carrier protein] reductase